MPTPDAVRRAGSHFLSRDSPHVARMVAEAGLRPGESVLDAGAGAGAITMHLAKAVQPGGSVLAVETDADAAAALRRQALPGVTVVEGDVLKVRLPTPLDAVVANPPFRILPALLRRLVAHGFGRAVLVMPEELVLRLVAAPGTENYGRLTVEVGAQAKTTEAFPLPRKAFDPPPAVACRVARLVPRPGVAATLPATFGPLLDAAWGAKARKLRHSLAPLASVLGLPPQEVTAALEAAAARDRTAMDLSPWESLQLAARLQEAVQRTGRGGDPAARQNA